jgi:cellulose synthase/poly-beta-1,6-N-acetylglucosamine synthase-like glycosyltransferase
LLFIDADVVLERQALGGLLALADRRGADLVTGFPRVELGSALDHTVMPAVGAVIIARYPPERVADPGSKVAFANGQLMLVRRSTYEAAGGHGAVVREILEDSRLAERIKAGGGRLLVVDARLVARTRMYESLRELVEGWSKNLFLLMGSSVRITLGWALLSVLLGSGGLLALLVAGLPFGVLAYLSVLAMQMILRARGGAPFFWAILAPVGAIFVAYLLLLSMWLHLGRRVIAWKGRSYVG